MFMMFLSSALLFAAVVLLLNSVGGVWDQLTARYIDDFSPMLDALSMDRTKLPQYMRFWGLALVSTALLFGVLLGMPPVAVAIGYLVFVAPRLVLQFLIKRRRMTLRDQMVGASVALSNSCRAGLTLAQGFETVSRETPEPLATELKRIVDDYNYGRPLAASIRETKNRINEDSFTLFASAVLVSLERGGRITEALERISASLQDSQRVERKLATDTASGRTVVMLLSAFPFGYLAISNFIFPEGTHFMFGTLVGQSVLAVVMAMVYLGARWCQKVISIDL
jgi:tight adherence protein B